MLLDRPIGQVTETASSTLIADRTDRRRGFPEIGVRPIARPMRRFDLQQMQQSRSLLIEALSRPADSYHVVRVTINQDSSIVRFVDGTEAKVQWQDAGFLSVFALVEEPILVPDSGTSVVICIDAEQSFLSGLGNPIHDFLFRPVIRAVNGAFTGSIAGTILGDSDGDGFAEPIANSRTTVFRSDGGFDPDAWVKTATGFSDSTGYYKVGFLLPGSYVVQLEATESNVLRSLFAHDVEVVAGEEFVFSVTLPVGTAAWNPSWR